jgi:DNA uptake protein ComE-like DNA-binding protein
VLILFFTRNVNPGPPEPRITVIELGADATDADENPVNNEVHNTVSRSLFDPNTADVAVLTRQGLNNRVAQRIIKYRNAGGRFRKADDLLKIYGLDPDLFEQIRPYIRISKITGAERLSFRDRNSPRKYPTKTIELNIADSADLEELPLIGPKRASMIIRYRHILGGFMKKSQLLEVYSIDSTVFRAIEQRVKVDAAMVKRININSVHKDSLYHPYLSRKQSAMILRYRDNHGIFTDLQTVCRAALLNDKLCAKIAPYLTLD